MKVNEFGNFAVNQDADRINNPCIKEHSSGKKIVNVREYAAAIIDNFEDFLALKGVHLNNEDKTGDENEAIIYGSDFDSIMESILVPLKELVIEAKTADGYNLQTYDKDPNEFTVYFNW